MATLTVTTNADSGTGSLRAAISSAASGDTITFAAALSGTTIVLSSSISFGSKILVINGLTDDVGDPVIAVSGNNTVQIFTTNPNPMGQSTDATLNNLILKNGYISTTGGGGAIKIVQTCRITAYNCKFVDNVSSYSGGAISNDFATAVFTNCLFIGNSCNSGEGGAYRSSGNSSFYSCIFRNNTSSSSGAAISQMSRTLNLSACIFDNNTTPGGTDWDVFVYASSNWGASTVNINDGNVVSILSSGYSASIKNTFNISGYNGLKNFIDSTNYYTFSGSGFLALPSTASVTLPSTITRTVYGAGVSNLSSAGASLIWDSTDSTKSVLIEKQNGANWDTVSSSGLSPAAISTAGVYRIWDGVVFLTTTATLDPVTLIVTNTNDSGSGSLRDVLASARAVDTVTFDASLSGSTITLSSGLTLSDDVTIVGLVDANGDPDITIDGDSTYRILSGSCKMTISNVVFANAGNNAIYNDNAAGSAFTNCVFTNNSATDSYGGAVLLQGNNPASETVTFTNCEFTGNESIKSSSMLGFGGAVTTQYISAVYSGCDFTSNTAGGAYGGAVAQFSPTATISLTNCTFTGNTTVPKSASSGLKDRGGAVYAVGTLTASGCTFYSNSVKNTYDGDEGGAVYLGNDGTLTNCSFSGNTANTNGGAICANYASVQLPGCTFSGNMATNGADYYGDTSSYLSVQSGIVTIPNVYIKSDADVGIANGAALSVSNSATVLGSVGAITRGYLATPPGTDLTSASLTNIVACDYGAGVSAFSIDEDSADWTAVNSNISVLLEKKVNGAWQTLAQPTGTSYSTTFVDGDEARIFDGVQFRTASAVVPQTLIVTNTNPTGAGSLAQAVLNARAVDTITFDASLAGETITLNAGLGPRNEVTIVGLTNDDGTPAITVDGNGNYTFNSSYPVHVSNVAFNGGWGAFSSAGGFDGSTFENCTFENMDLNVFELSNSSQTAESVSFTDCIFTSNDAADMLITGAVNATLNGGNVLTEGFDLTDAGTVVITNSGYNGVGGYTAPSSGSVSVAGSGNIALPDSAIVTIAQTVTRSEFGAGVSSFAADGLTLSWTATDSTKSVLLEVENGADWDTVDDDATSPATVSAVGTYRVWDGVAFFSTSVEPEPAIAVRPGRRVCQSLQFDYTNEGAETIDAGTAIKIGSAFGVIETAILPGATGTVTTLGTWFIPCLDTTVADFGDVAYWDDENQRVTSNDSGTMRIGLFVKPVSSGETEATVMIYPASAASSGD